MALPEADMLRAALKASLQINTGDIAQQHSEPEQIKQAIYQARLIQINNLLMKHAF